MSRKFGFVQYAVEMRRIVVVVAAVVFLCACHKAPPNAQQEALARECPDLKSWDDCAARQATQVEALKDAADAAAQKAVAEGVAAAIASSAALTPPRRAAWVRQCAAKPDVCKDWQLDAIIKGAPEGERPSLMRVQMAVETENIAKFAKDGEQVSLEPARFIESVVARDDLGVLDEMPTTTLADAKKDPNGSRGKTLKVSGRIIEIRKTGADFEGSLVADNMTIVRFVTPLSTANLYEDSSAKFRGIFLQEYDFANVSGGQTRSLLVIGVFDIPENQRKVAAKTAAVVAPAPQPNSQNVGNDSPSPAPINTCDPPYVTDSTGRKTYKPKCL